ARRRAGGAARRGARGVRRRARPARRGGGGGGQGLLRGRGPDREAAHARRRPAGEPGRRAPHAGGVRGRRRAAATGGRARQRTGAGRRRRPACGGRRGGRLERGALRLLRGTARDCARDDRALRDRACGCGPRAPPLLYGRDLRRRRRARLARIREGGPPEARRRHQERGRLLVRERIERLLDPGSPFLELMAFAADGCYDDPTPAGGLVTGIGTVAGHQAMVIGNDVTVKGGTLYPLTVQKQLRAQQIALENRLPCAYLVDSGGAFLPLQAEIFTPGGRIFFNEA